MGAAASISGDREGVMYPHLVVSVSVFAALEESMTSVSVRDWVLSALFAYEFVDKVGGGGGLPYPPPQGDR